MSTQRQIMKTGSCVWVLDFGTCFGGGRWTATLAVSFVCSPRVCLAQLKVASGLQWPTMLPWMSEPRSL